MERIIECPGWPVLRADDLDAVVAEARSRLARFTDVELSNEQASAGGTGFVAQHGDACDASSAAPHRGRSIVRRWGRSERRRVGNRGVSSSMSTRVLCDMSPGRRGGHRPLRAAIALVVLGISSCSANDRRSDPRVRRGCRDDSAGHLVRDSLSRAADHTGRDVIADSRWFDSTAAGNFGYVAGLAAADAVPSAAPQRSVPLPHPCCRGLRS